MKEFSSSIISVKQLRQDLAKYVAAVEAGRSFTVVKRSRPIFKISPPTEPAEERWEEVIDFTKIEKGGVDIAEVLSRL